MANLQQIVTVLNGNTSVTTTDANITATSIIVVTPYADIAKGGTEMNSFWVTLGSGAWDLSISVSLPFDVDFSYHILKY